MNSATKNPPLHFGSLSGLICFTGFAGAYFAGLNPFGAITWLWIWVPVFMIGMAMKKVRTLNGDVLTYGNGLITGIKTAFFSSLLYCLLLYLLGKVSPHLMEIYLKQMEEGLEVTKSFFSDAMMDEMYEQLEKTDIFNIAWSEFLRKMFGGLFISLVAAAFLQRKPHSI